MISSSAQLPLGSLEVVCHTFIYGLGYESRSLSICEHAQAENIIALQMPPLEVHSYGANGRRARELGHLIVDDFDAFVDGGLTKLLGTALSPRSVAIDISSINRAMMYRLLLALGSMLNDEDKLSVLYCPASYNEPDWQFPQIERLGPIMPEFSGYASDPSKPVCLVLGLGFEPGVSMGIISQLEPSASFCFWGTGADARFEQAVRRANFDFDFTGFNTRTLPYLVYDPKGAFAMLENLVYGLVNDFNVIVVPMGPKIFAFTSLLLGVSYPGRLAIWRAQQRRSAPFDARPAERIVRSEMQVEEFRHACLRLVQLAD